MPSAAASVVFTQGEYDCKTRCGTARVSIPRNVHLAEIQGGLARLFEGRRECPEKK